MLGDGRVGVHYRNCDMIVSMEFCSKIILAFFKQFYVLKKLS